jgi:hypothetical protein
MKLTPCGFEDFSNVAVSFYTSRLESRPWQNYEELLIIHFASTQRVGWKDIGFMDAMKLAGIRLWQPRAVIFDFTGLYYEWGDEMDSLFRKSAADPWGEAVPKAAVVSAENRAGLTSLLRQEMGIDPETVLFNSLEQAVAAVERLVGK